MTDPIAARGAQPGTEAGRRLALAIPGGKWMVLEVEAEAHRQGRDRTTEQEALASGTHEPAVDDFGNQYLSPVRQQGRETLDVDQFRKVVIGTLNNNGWSVYRNSGSWVDRRAVADALRAALAADPRPET